MRILAPLLLLAASFTVGAFAQNAAPDPTQAPPAPEAKSETPSRAWVVMETSKGTIVLELDGEKAPISVANFLNYVRKGFYDGTIFHRVKPDFMIQGGGFDTSGNQKETDPPIKNEYRNGLKNTAGTIAMARTPNPDSATSQFFINVVNNPFLDGDQGPGYAVFGKVIGGMETVDAIRVVPTGRRTLNMRGGRGLEPRPNDDVPLELVVITSVREVNEDAAKAAAKAASAGSSTPPAASPPAPAAPPPAAPSAPTTPGGA